MAFRELVQTLQTPAGATERFKVLNAYERLLFGTAYEDLPNSFDEERDDYGNTIRIRRRRPSNRYNIPWMLMRRTQAAMWGDEQQPRVTCAKGPKKTRNKVQESLLEYIISESGIPDAMTEAYEIGQPGSVAIIVRKRDDAKPDFDVIEGKYAFPVFDDRNPSKLVLLAHVYDVKGEKIIADMSVAQREANEIAVDPILKDETYWYRIEVDAEAERRFKPLTANEYENLGSKRKDGTTIQWVVDKEYPHDFGCVPGVWVRNLVGRKRSVDGPCTFFPIVDNIVDIDYSLSQTSRALRYNADPILFIEKGQGVSATARPAGDEDKQAARGEDGSLSRGASQVLVESQGGDAKLVEIEGKGITELREFILLVRELSLEIVGARKSMSDNETGPMSGVAMDKLDKAERLLVKLQRRAYGDNGLVPLARLVLTGIQRDVFTFEEVSSDDVDPNVPMQLVWPTDETLRGQDLLYTMQGLQVAAGIDPKAPQPLASMDAVRTVAMAELGVDEDDELPESDDSGTSQTARPDGAQEA